MQLMNNVLREYLEKHVIEYYDDILIYLKILFEHGSMNYP